MEEEPMAFCADGVESGPDSGPEVMGEEGLREAMAEKNRPRF